MNTLIKRPIRRAKSKLKRKIKYTLMGMVKGQLKAYMPMVYVTGILYVIKLFI